MHSLQHIQDDKDPGPSQVSQDHIGRVTVLQEYHLTMTQESVLSPRGPKFVLSMIF